MVTKPLATRTSTAPLAIGLRALAVGLGLVPDGRRARPAVHPGRIARRALDRLDPDAALAIRVPVRGALQRRGELAGGGARNLEQGFVRGDADRTDLVLGDVAAPAKQGQDPARIGIVP